MALLHDIRCCFSLSEQSQYQVEHEGQDEADQNTACDGEVERFSLTSQVNIPRQPAQKRNLVTEQHDRANGDEHCSDDDDGQSGAFHWPAHFSGLYARGGVLSV